MISKIKIYDSKGRVTEATISQDKVQIKRNGAGISVEQIEKIKRVLEGLE